jgi:NAD(P)H-dependent FMN reductase
MPLRILVILGSTRESRNGDKVARWFLDVAQEHGADAEFELIDLRDWQLPYYDSPLPPAFATPEGRVKEWSDLVASGDGYVFVTPEYNHGYPAVLKTHLDAVYVPWNRKPMGIVSYGAAGGGYRAAEQLRQVAVELQMAAIREQVGLPLVWTLFDDAGRLKTADVVRPYAERFVDDLLWWARALRSAREVSMPM